MAYTDEQLETALRAADAAGNAEDAKALAQEWQRRKANSNPQGGEFTTSSGYAPSEDERGKFVSDSKDSGTNMGFFNKSLAETMGAPVDMATSAINRASREVDALGGLIPDWMKRPDGSTGLVNPIPKIEKEQAFGGTESIRRGMDNIGVDTPDREPEGFAENVFSVGGEVAGFAVPFAALARRYRGAENVGGRLLASMDDALVKNPVGTLAMEAGGAAGAGVGREIADRNEMGGAGSMATEIVGGLMGSAAGPRLLLDQTGRIGQNILRQIFPNAEKEASRRIQSLVRDPVAAARAIDDLKGSSLLPSARTQEPGLMALERTVLDQDPALAADVAKKTSDAMESVVASIRRSGKVQSARKFIEAKRDRLLASLDARIERAGERAANALQKISEDATSADLGIAMRSQLEEALADARVQEQMLWQAVPQDTKVPVSSTLKKFNELDKALAQAQADDMPAVANQLMRGRKGVKAIQLSEMDGLYKKLGEVSRIARRDGNRNQARIAEELRESILDDIGNAQGSPDVMEALQTARGFSRQMMERFRKGPVGKILETDTTGTPRVPAEMTLERTVGRGGTPGRLAADALVRATDDPQSLEAIQNFLKRRFMDAAVNDGRVAGARADAFIRQNAPLLENFPHLRDQFRAARTAEDVARRVEKSSDGLRRAFERPAVSDAARFLGAPVDQEIKRIFSAPDPQKTMREIAKMAGKDKSGAALEGLKSGVTDYLLDRVAMYGIDEFGRKPISGQALLRMLDDDGLSLVIKPLFSEQELRKMRKSAELLAKMERSVKSKAKLDDIVPNGMGAVLGVPMRVLGAKLGAKFAGGGGAGVSLQAAQLGSSRMSRLWNRLTVGQAEQVVKEAMLDPEVMKHLLLDFNQASPGQIRAHERFFRNWGLSRGLGLFEGGEEDDQ